jgi:putative flippase GtrA
VIGAQFGRFVVVGVLGTALDFALLWLLLRAGVWSPLAVSAAYLTATAAQFVANRAYSFRAFDRPALDQARTYAVVSAINWGVAVAFVELGTALFAPLGYPTLAPLMAKALSIPPSVAVSFFGNRHLTFGRGIRATLRDLLGRRRS